MNLAQRQAAINAAILATIESAGIVLKGHPMADHFSKAKQLNAELDADVNRPASGGFGGGGGGQNL